MDLFWPLVILRWLHLSSLLAVFGSTLFAHYVTDQAHKRDPLLVRRELACAWIAFASGIVLVMLALVDMTEQLSSLAAPALWQAFFLDTGFGGVWAARLIGLGALVVCVGRVADNGWVRKRTGASAGLSGVLLASLAWLGHAAAGEGPAYFAGLAAYACHVLAAGAWFGGLLGLAQALSRGPDGAEPRHLTTALEAFSRLAMAAVMLIVASGVFSAVLHIAHLTDLVHTTYGLVLMAKVSLFAGVMALAAANRWVLLPRWRQQPASATRKALVQSVVLEQVLGLAVIALAAALGALAPAD